MADLAIIGGKVVTVDSKFSIAQAVAVKGDRIVAVGTNQDIKSLIGRDTKVIDLKGKTVLPVINDSHMHAAFFGSTKPPVALDLTYPTVKSISDIVRVITEKVKTAKPGEWIRGAGFDEGFLEECLKDKSRYPNRWDLDAVSPNNPVILQNFFGHQTLANSKALEMAGIAKDTPQPSGGEIVKGPATGELTGLLRELAAECLLMRVVPPFTRSQKREAILSVIRGLNTLGITSITDAALGPGGSDAPVAYPNWQTGIQSAVFRESKATGRVSGPEQRITCAEAIRMFTIEGAWQEHMEHLKGSIGPNQSVSDGAVCQF
jgi:hypothetical protein